MSSDLIRVAALFLQTLDEAERRRSERIEEIAAKELAERRAAELRSSVEGKVNKACLVLRVPSSFAAHICPWQWHSCHCQQLPLVVPNVSL